MNEIGVSSLLESDYPPLEQAVAELRGQNEELERFIEQLLAEISDLTDQFEAKIREFAANATAAPADNAQVPALESANAQLEAQLQARDREIAELREEAARLRGEVAAAPGPAAPGRGAEGPGSEDSAAENLRRQVESLRQELASTKIELLKKNKQVNPAANEHANLNQLKRQNEELEGELDRVRGRAAQLTETLDRRERELKQQQQAWAGEMQAMREMLGKRGGTAGQGKGQAASDTSVTSDTSTVVRDELEKRSSGNTAVVDSVLAQFAKIQRDVSRRRAQQKTS